uniref:Uncharacterized protein n=1 Tax=uncultured marine virus TaxID=186617 RepID=A0A0F7L668_9VIRU|nr:hypothetical protein [uncultured marine virus]
MGQENFDFHDKGHRTASKTAYFELLRSGAMGNQEAAIFAYLKDSGPRTLNQIEQDLGIKINAVSGRVNGLKKKGMVKECNKKHCPISGRLVTPVDIERG